VGCEAAKNTNKTQRGAGIGAVGGAILGGVLGNNVEVTAPNGKTYIYNANEKASKADSLVPGLQQFIQLNNVAPTTAGGTGELD
jgi:hypothetical protein